MQNANACRANALEVISQADSASDATTRLLLLGIAMAYARLAEQAERNAEKYARDATRKVAYWAMQTRYCQQRREDGSKPTV